MVSESKIKAFGMTNMLIEADIEKIEKQYDFNLKKQQKDKTSSDIEKAYFPQFESSLRAEAKCMAKSYELFYCLEKTIRNQISEMLESQYGKDWWNHHEVIPKHVISEVKNRIKKENDSVITPRSTEELDYTTFGELSDIIKSNWTIFASVFNSIKAVEKIMSNLNTLRAPIAHCSLLAEDEILRLELSLRDWFRLAE